MAIGQRNVTLEEFLTWSEQEPPLELFDGEVKPKMAPSLPHGALQIEIGVRLEGHARARRLGRTFSEIRTTAARNSPVPDLSFYRWDRIPRQASGKLLTYPTALPDLIVEIASPGQSRTSLERRCAWFVSAGVAIALLVWPVSESITVFRSGYQPRTLCGDDPIDLAPVLPDFSLTVRELFDSAYGR